MRRIDPSLRRYGNFYFQSVDPEDGRKFFRLSDLRSVAKISVANVATRRFLELKVAVSSGVGVSTLAASVDGDPAESAKGKA